ncbi:tetratricopeptide repeat protein [Vulcanococcus limneticus]|uniref:tetratricopeptide repeat protein n=1 Tax=Vulcanococcus limneticus TaxID=2170428 RepID=UPI00398BD95A
MPTPTRSSATLLWTGAGAIALCLVALAGGWWLGRQQASGIQVDSRRAALVQESDLLGQKVIRGDANDSDRQRYLELLVSLDRSSEAIAVLEPMADREPDRWALRLMLAELRRDQGDAAGAERELRQILNRSPSQIDALQLLTLIRLERGEAAAAENQVKGVYGGLIRPEPKPQALGVGLLLAELQQKRDQAPAAERTYQELALAFPEDQRPLIGLALLRHSRGNNAGALEALQQARRRGPDPGKADPRLDALAASWGLEKLRAKQGASSGPKPPGGPPQLEAKPPTAPQSPAPQLPALPAPGPTGPPAP